MSRPVRAPGPVALTRRALLAGLASTLAAPRAGAQPTAGLRVEDVRLPGRLSKRMTLMIPTHLRADEKVPLVVLLHGLGETGDERAGAYAWVERYGLLTAYDRLRNPPVRRTTSHPWLGDDRLAEINAAQATSPLRGLVFACPYLPRLPDRGAPLDVYATWIVDVVIPHVAARAPVLDSPAGRIVGGCSLGGRQSLEVFLRRPEAFGAWCGVQTAVGEPQADAIAGRIADAISKSGPKDIFLETSSLDPFRRANEKLRRALAKRGIPHTWRMPPGPHDQPWLREVGTLELVAWAAARSTH